MRQHYTNKKYLPSVVSFSMFVCLLKNLLLKRAMYYNVTMFVCLTSVTPIILRTCVCVCMSFRWRVVGYTCVLQREGMKI